MSLRPQSILELYDDAKRRAQIERPIPLPPACEGAYTAAVERTAPGCGHVRYLSIRPTHQIEHAHQWQIDPYGESIACSCGLRFDGRYWCSIRGSVKGQHDQRMADKLQSLTDDNTQLLTENARLRRSLERLERTKR